MEYLEGTTLEQLIDTEVPLDLRSLIEISTQVCDALHYSHSKHVIHRDIKPSNILWHKELRTVKLIDFGLALNNRDPEELRLTVAGGTIGTVLYMSPEQCKAQNLDYRTDIYSFACVLFQMISGKPPFQADDYYSVMLAHAHSSIPRLSTRSLSSKTTISLQRIMDKALSKEPEGRHSSLAQLAAELADVWTSERQYSTGLDNDVYCTNNTVRHAGPAKNLNYKIRYRISVVLAAIGCLVCAIFWTAYGASIRKAQALSEARQFQNEIDKKVTSSQSLELARLHEKCGCAWLVVAKEESLPEQRMAAADRAADNLERAALVCNIIAPLESLRIQQEMAGITGLSAVRHTAVQRRVCRLLVYEAMELMSENNCQSARDNLERADHMSGVYQTKSKADIEFLSDIRTLLSDAIERTRDSQESTKHTVPTTGRALSELF